MDIEPLFGLRLATPSLELRLPRREELLALALVAEEGIHPRDEMPFFFAWTDEIGRPGWRDGFVDFHERARREWSPHEWSLLLGVWAEQRAIGVQEVGATDFAARRSVVTGSWLGRRFQGRGYGTEMRAAVLELAFIGLDAVEAVSGALEGNVASARVSEKLGYAAAGEGHASPRGIPVREQRYRLTRERWETVPRPQVTLAGLDRCLPLFGL